MKYYEVTVKRNMYAPSEDYLEPFGFELCDPDDGGVVRSFLLHQSADLLACRLSKRARGIVKQVMEEVSKREEKQDGEPSEDREAG